MVGLFVHETHEKARKILGLSCQNGLKVLRRFVFWRYAISMVIKIKSIAYVKKV